MRVLFAAAAIALCSCHPTVYFETQIQGSTTVPGSPLGGLLSALPPSQAFSNFDFSQTQDFQNQGVTKQDVQSVKMKRLTLQITAPNTADFSWLSSVNFYAQTGNQKDLIATKSNVNQLGLVAPDPQFDLDLPNVELKPYIVAPSMSITSDATGQQPSQDITLQATVRIGVNAEIIK